VTSTWSNKGLNQGSEALFTKLVIVTEHCQTQNDEGHLLVRLDKLKVTAGVLMFQ
jgi:hypothetical protein